MSVSLIESEIKVQPNHIVENVHSGDGEIVVALDKVKQGLFSIGFHRDNVAVDLSGEGGSEKNLVAKYLVGENAEIKDIMFEVYVDKIPTTYFLFVLNSSGDVIDEYGELSHSNLLSIIKRKVL